MKLRPGDLVMLNVLSEADLFTELPGPDDSGVASSHMLSSDVAVVVALSGSDCRCAYIVGPRGIGWVFGAFLKTIKNR